MEIDWDQLTGGAIRVLTLAEKEASDLGHLHFGTLHMLVGLLRLDASEAKALRSQNLSLEKIHVHLAKLPSREVSTELPIPFDQEVKELLLRTGAIATNREKSSKVLGDLSWITSRHLLFSLLESDRLAVAPIFRECGITLVTTIRQLVGKPDQTPIEPCSRKGDKIPYPLRNDALIALARIRTIENLRGECRVYQCRSCGAWHLTSAFFINRPDLVDLDFTDANLSYESLPKRDLGYGVFRRANLHSVDFSGSRLYRADFRNSNLTGARLVGANLGFADFRAANLTGADLSNSDLSGARFDGCDLTDANLTNCCVDDTNLGAAIGHPRLL